jgi:hypothetical protein
LLLAAAAASWGGGATVAVAAGKSLGSANSMPSLMPNPLFDSSHCLASCILLHSRDGLALVVGTVEILGYFSNIYG